MRDDSLDARSIVFSRVVRATPEQLWAAWTQPDLLKQWWGPQGFSCTIAQMDVRPGGEWKMVMHGPDGTDYPNYARFETVEEPGRISYHHGDVPGRPDWFDTEVTFTPRDGATTQVDMRMTFPSAEARRQCVETYGAVEGGNQTLDRMEALLARPGAG